MSSKRVLFSVAICGLGPLLWLLSTSSHQVYWAATARNLHTWRKGSTEEHLPDADGTIKHATHGNPELEVNATKVRADEDFGNTVQAVMSSEMSLVKHNTAGLSVTPEDDQLQVQSAEMAVPQDSTVHQGQPSPVRPLAAQISGLGHSLQINDTSGLYGATSSVSNTQQMYGYIGADGPRSTQQQTREQNGVSAFTAADSVPTAAVLAHVAAVPGPTAAAPEAFADAVTPGMPRHPARLEPVTAASAQHAHNNGSHKLTKELVKSVAPSGPIMVTSANHQWRDFTLNWVQHAESAGIPFLVGAMDDELLHELAVSHVPCFGMQSGLSSEDAFGWGSAQFHKLTRTKIGLVLAFTSMGFDILISDVDTVWLRNPMPFVAAYPEAQILVSSDTLRSTTEDGGLELYPDAAAANSGIILFRSGAQAFAEAWNQVLVDDDTYWEQAAFNDLMHRGALAPTDQNTTRLFRGLNGTMLMGILPVATFCSGHTFFVQHMPDVLGLEPYVVHATYQFSETPGKRHRMREALMWDVDPPEYYRPAGGLLSFDMQLDDLVRQSPPYLQYDNATQAQVMSRELDDSKMGHFNLVNAQLQQVRNALGLASSLNRTLVMPQLWCGMDRWWGPHGGIIPGSSLKLPYPCPMDHIFDLNHMLQQQPEEKFGPFIDWRESSLFNNTKFPAEDLAQAVYVHACQGNESLCSSGNPAEADSLEVALQHNLTDRQLQNAFQNVNSAAVLHFEDVRTAFGGFAEAADAIRFQRRTELYTSTWCCVDERPGHIWYDMWWDLIPHTDRHQRAVHEAWKPITGP